MQYEAWSKATENFRALAFSEIVRKCVERARTSHVDIFRAEPDEIAHLTQQARESFPLAPDNMIHAIHARNPDTLRILRRAGGKDLGLFAYLPLNMDGMEALVTGQFDGTAPKPDWVCAPGEEPEAVYIWLAWMPGGLARSLGAIAIGFQQLGERGCPVFSRAATPQSVRIHETMGFMDGRQVYPRCKPDLLVAFPERPAARARNETKVKVARSFEDIAQVLSVRSATYIAEQFCLYEEEFDGNDFCSTHFLGLVDGDAAGCIRIRFFADFAKIERLAVRAEYRQSRLSFALVKAAIRHCELKGYQTLYGHSRLDLVPFWGMFGFKSRTDRPDFSFANVRYVEMVRTSEKMEHALGLDASPMVLVRPEGAWDFPGPLDISRSEHDPNRKLFLQKRMKTINDKDFSK